MWRIVAGDLDIEREPPLEAASLLGAAGLNRPLSQFQCEGRPIKGAELNRRALALGSRALSISPNSKQGVDEGRLRRITWNIAEWNFEPKPRFGLQRHSSLFNGDDSQIIQTDLVANAKHGFSGGR
jgi:hypothetical protein